MTAGGYGAPMSSRELSSATSDVDMMSHHELSNEDSRTLQQQGSPMIVPLRPSNTSIKSKSTSSAPHTATKSTNSPPPTPRISRDVSEAHPIIEEEETFHNYMRAFYPFHPSSTISSTSSDDADSITVPINMGDVILVHSIHPNGWADGTLLASGARGWLPTNYCEAYDHDTIHSLLNALTQLWDLVRNNQVDNLAAFTRQDYVRAIIAGVRIFLEKAGCLNRESELIESHIGLRRLRKGLLGDLSALVKIAKRLQELVQTAAPTRAIYDALDELVLKAFKVVIRAVRFLDVWSQDTNDDNQSYSDQQHRPLTPPESDTQTSRTHEADNGSVDLRSDYTAASHTVWSDSGNSQMQSPTPPVQAAEPVRPPSVVARRQSKRISISHRASYIGQATGVRSKSLASERLNAAHDAFLGYIGSFIGLHLHSRSSTDLLHTTQQSVIAARKLLLVADEVWERDGRRSAGLEQAKDTMYGKLAELVQATKDILVPAASDEEVFMPDQGKQLVLAATSCVRAAGECVSKTRGVIEHIGDFEFEPVGLGLPDSLFRAGGSVGESPVDRSEAVGDEAFAMNDQKTLPIPPQPADAPPPPPAGSDGPATMDTKPLPEPPTQSPIQTLEALNGVDNEPSPIPPVLPPIPDIPEMTTSLESSVAEMADEWLAEVGDDRISKATIVQKASGAQIVDLTLAATNDTTKRGSLRATRQGKAVRSDSVNDSTTDSSLTRRSSVHEDGTSVLSQDSTRATTPDKSMAATSVTESNMMNSFGSISELQQASEDASVMEDVMLHETTHAHEIIYNKEGQITGGSLPALVEKLTMHDSTPDAMFVNTFYLTFRLFTTPVALSNCLIDRFENVVANSKISIPVRLRVYNVFKGWLESHWQADCDTSALVIITDFANGRLREVLPSPAKRLAELASKVGTEQDGPIVPRLLSALGRTNTTATGFSVVDSQVPAPIITKGQLNALRNAAIGGAQCSVLDFDPLELARQFTLIESRIFCSISPIEVLGSEWTKKGPGNKAINVRAMSTLSTDLTNLVADSILHLEDAKKRAQMIKHWIKIAARCLDLNNYDSLMAIICSLNSSMVLRLKRTWEQLSQKTKTKYDELVAVVDVGRNYAVLRQRLQTHVAPCIPFVGMFLTDLTFVDVGNQATRQLPGNAGGQGVTVINFDKHMKTAKIIGQLQRFQIPYKLAPVPEMQDWMQSQIKRMQTNDQVNVQNHYRRSLLLEPRDAPNLKRSPIERNESSTSLANGKGLDIWASMHFKRSEKHSQTSPAMDQPPQT